MAINGCKTDIHASRKFDTSPSISSVQFLDTLKLTNLSNLWSDVFDYLCRKTLENILFEN